MVKVNDTMADQLEYQKFLSTKVKDLELDLETSICHCLEKLKKELSDKNINLWPDFYFGDEWGCYDKTISIAIPFYLATPELRTLEGYVPKDNSLVKILRHETGHAINYAFKLWKRKDWKETFGDFNKNYPERYLNKVNPWSKNYVKHLHYVDDGHGSDPHYAQRHPDEDWAETFAVWLSPKSAWRKKYQNWPGALAKLEYVDKVIEEIAGQKPINTNTKRDGDHTSIEDTVSEWFGLDEEKDEKIQEYIRDLKELFIKPEGKRRRLVEASYMIKKYSKPLAENVSAWILGSNKNSVRKCLRQWATLCRKEGLYYKISEETNKLIELTTLLSHHVNDSIGRIKY